MILTDLIKEALEMPSKQMFTDAPPNIRAAADHGAGFKMSGWLCIGSAALNLLAWYMTKRPSAISNAEQLMNGAAIAYSIGILLYNGYAKNAMWYHTRKSEPK